MVTVALIGPPGAGKTSAGSRLAKQLGVAFHDVDDLVEQVAGQSVSDIFVLEGEPRFRELEAEQTLRALDELGGVVSLGGGGPMTESIREALTRHVVVFLDVDVKDAAHRVGFDQSRPLLAVNPRATWVKLMRERRPVYESLATFTVSSTGSTPTKVATAIREWLEETGRVTPSGIVVEEEEQA